MGFLGFCNVYTLRVNLSMAIVQMVNDSQTNDGGQHAYKVYGLTGASMLPPAGWGETACHARS